VAVFDFESIVDLHLSFVLDRRDQFALHHNVGLYMCHFGVGVGEGLLARLVLLGRLTIVRRVVMHLHLVTLCLSAFVVDPESLVVLDVVELLDQLD